ncbi:MAG: glycosyltransferase family 2 protein [Caldilineales bacterium]
MPAPIASVIIPSYNGKHLLATCLPALRQQTYPADRFEIIVVDDASSDGTADFLAANFPQVRVVALERNSGFIAACNAGVAAARGAVLVLLNNDTEAEPGWLEALITALEENPQAGSAASKMLLFDRRDHLHTAGDMMGVDGIPRNRGVWEQDEGQYDDQRQVFGACGGAAAYRRQAWEQAGGFDPALFMYMEDVDLAWRLQLLGWQAVYAPERASTTRSARPAAVCWPVTTSAATRSWSSPATGRARCCVSTGARSSALAAHRRRRAAQLALARPRGTAARPACRAARLARRTQGIAMAGSEHPSRTRSADRDASDSRQGGRGLTVLIHRQK